MTPLPKRPEESERELGVSFSSDLGNDGLGTAKSRPRVLIAEDDTTLAGSLERVLSEDYDVVVVWDGLAAQRVLAEDNSVSVVLLDMMMPGLLGCELFAWIESSRPDLADRTIIMSGGAWTERVASFWSSTSCNRLRKPFPPSHLLALIRTLLR